MADSFQNVSFSELTVESVAVEISSPRFTVGELQDVLISIAGRRVLLMLTDNTSSMITARSGAGGVMHLRAHRMFLDAPDDVVTALGRWLSGKKLRRDLIQEFINANEHLVRELSQGSRSPVCRVEGKYYNLRTIHEAVNTQYLDGRSKAAVTWGRKISRRRTRSVRLGSYDPLDNLITLSQRLDRRDIPHYMIEYVMFHEMLHEVLGIGRHADGRRDIHHKTFRMMEKTYPHYEKARAFETKKWG